MPAVPAIIMGGASLGSALIGRSAANAAAKLSPAEQAAQRAQLALTSDLTGRGKELYSTGMPWLRQTGGYYSTLLGGNRAAIRGALQPETNSMNEMYRGASVGINRGMLRGADRANALAELNRQRVGQMASLVPTARINAAANLGSLAGGALAAGQSASSTAGSIAGDVSRTGAANRQYANEVGYRTGRDTGGLLFDILSSIPGAGPKGKTLPTHPLPGGNVNWGGLPAGVTGNMPII